MFNERRRSRKGLITFFALVTIFFGSNILGHMLARDQIESALLPTRIPEGSLLPFGKTFTAILRDFSVTIPYEIGGFSMVGATARDLNLQYQSIDPANDLDVRISGSKFHFEGNQAVRYPEALLLRKGLSGQLTHEVFAQGPSSDGISINPYRAIREGLAARLRDVLEPDPAVILGRVAVVGDKEKGQVWRVYLDTEGNTQSIEGAIYDGENIANVSIHFEKAIDFPDPFVQAFSKGVTFAAGDIKKNEALADGCMTELPHDIEPVWETGCRQGHLVAQMISQGETLHIARRLYGEYVADQNKKGIKDLFDELHFEMHYTDGWEKFIARMIKDNSWLKPENETAK
jgi:hypothetical protein